MSNPVATLFRIPELKEKILFTLLILLIYRLGAHVVVPGIDVAALEAFAGQLQGTVFGIYDGIQVNSRLARRLMLLCST
jgi:preprotein translocase subunit SecY